MQKQPTFHVYNASAGSGKTYTIAREYMQIILGSKDPFTFQKILAITFTNKAAQEMKERVVENLKTLSKGESNDLIEDVRRNLNVEFKELVKRSSLVLEAILQNYTAFSIQTIDSFTHKLIRSFAFDLKLPMNFDVELEVNVLLNEAVEQLIAKIGKDQQITDFLIDFSISKADEDKSWDISRELNEVAKILLKEDDIEHIKAISEKSLDSFQELKTNLKKKSVLMENELKSIGIEFGELIDQKGLQPSDFNRSIIPNFFRDVSQMSPKFKFWARSATIQKALENQNFYKKSTAPDIASVINALSSTIEEFFNKCYQLYGQISLTEIFLKNLNPVAVITNIYQELETIKEEKNIQLNSEFNRYISESIKGQPVPYIYEKLGMRFQYFFIDEMQDTSKMQWQNLIPLLRNALAQEDAALFLVGDAKQSIYRWRGSQAEQFIELGSEKHNLFQVDKEIHRLPKNYRSYSEIIEFNNDFFRSISEVFSNEGYAELYRNENNQQTNHQSGGYVSLQFIDKKLDEDDKATNFAKSVHAIIQNIESDYRLDELCVLVRKKAEGVVIANYLSEKGIDIVSSETLLLENSPKVKFIINLFRFFSNSKDQLTLFEILYFLHNHLQIEIPRHQFFAEMIDLDVHQLFQKLETYDIDFRVADFPFLSLYDQVEEVVRSFRFTKSSDAHLQFFLDVILGRQKKGDDIQKFLEFWDVRKDKLSISAVQKSNAVSIMTVHKSKGLEFPVVIFPSDEDIYRNNGDKSWMNPKEIHIDFPELMVDINQNLSKTGAAGLEIYEESRSHGELDNINLMYVAFTRAIEKLFVITTRDGLSSKGQVNLRFFSGLYIKFLQEKGLWKDVDQEYHFGTIERRSNLLIDEDPHENLTALPSIKWQEHQLALLNNSSKLWDTKQGQAIDYGNLIHEMLAEIFSEDDIQLVCQSYVSQGLITSVEQDPLEQLLRSVVKHPILTNYFGENIQSQNEREFSDGFYQIVKPDKVVFEGQNVVIIDYKTGSRESKHEQQIRNYVRVLQQMDYVVEKKLLVYINDEVLVHEVE
ncbi:MAG: DNA helicase UvrD [Flavobacteriaceae bacterium]|nr:DNA helicase UvrD [Flavobacteriaceae bacterium]